jgi:hypothetical protein
MAGHSAILPVQAQVYTTLANDPALKALSPVFDEVPTKAVFPWVLITDIREKPDDTLGTVGRALVVGLDAWSQVEGFQELEQIAEEVIRLLDIDTLPDPTGWTTDHSLYLSGFFDREADGITRHVRLEFDIGVHHS